MIIFDLVCRQGHVFEGWFDSSAEFDRQKERKLVCCPVCDDAEVARRPSAKVQVSKGHAAASKDHDAASAGTPAGPAGDAGAATRNQAHAAMAGLPPELVARLREIVRNTEDVGERFPEEARKIHYEEVPHRPIRGRASAEEAEALKEEGVEFGMVPPFLAGESH